jgi:hypothetical protein
MTRWTSLLAAATLLLVVVAAGCSTSMPSLSDDPSPAVSAAEPSAASPSAGQRIVLRFDHQVVPATLVDTAAGREFSTRLPLTLKLRDPWGQAKSGPLPHRIETTGAVPATDPEVGGIYYAPDSQTLAIFYDDLGQTVPPPGLIRLGVVDSDLTTLAAAGNRIQVSVELPDGISS